jgi:hypothetical protein
VLREPWTARCPVCEGGDGADAIKRLADAMALVGDVDLPALAAQFAAVVVPRGAATLAAAEQQVDDQPPSLVDFTPHDDSPDSAAPRAATPAQPSWYWSAMSDPRMHQV